ncbi:hypothetical protein HaLaN_07941, partial [Haematococcus lacustris]
MATRCLWESQTLKAEPAGCRPFRWPSLTARCSFPSAARRMATQNGLLGSSMRQMKQTRRSFLCGTVVTTLPRKSACTFAAYNACHAATSPWCRLTSSPWSLTWWQLSRRPGACPATLLDPATRRCRSAAVTHCTHLT